MHRAEAGGVAGVDDLLGRRGIEPDRGFDRQDQDGFVAEGVLERARGVADGEDGFMGTRGIAETRTRAGLVHDPDLQLFNRDGVGGTYPHTCQACDAQLGVDSKIHERGSELGAGEPGARIQGRGSGRR